MKHFLTIALVVTTVCTLTSNSVRAQPGSGGPAPTGPTGPTQIPIDGGASLLLAGGIAYGLRKLRRHRSN